MRIKRCLMFLSVRVKRRLLFSSVRGDFLSVRVKRVLLFPSVLGDFLSMCFSAGLNIFGVLINTPYDGIRNTRK